TEQAFLFFDLAGIFGERAGERGGERQEKKIEKPAPFPQVNTHANTQNIIEDSGKAEMRQNAILGRIRQIGNCRIRDIEEILPNSSERTIRYDLQSLVEKNLIERIGTGGPSVYYRVRQQAVPTNVGNLS